MDDLTKRIKDLYVIPCGPMEIAANGICRKSLRDSLDTLLDRLTVEINPSQNSKDSGDKYERGPNGEILELREDSEERKKRLIEEGKLRAEVSHEIRKYREQLQGNSKLLQDISGKYESI